MGALKKQPGVQEGERIHPPIHAITDALTFRIARLNAVNERAGIHWFRKEHDLSLNEWRILGLTHALEPVAFQTIRDILIMDKGQLSRAIKALGARGLIETKAAQGDARAIELVTTEVGKVLHDKVLAFTAERNESVVAALSPAECREFLRLLRKMSDHNDQLSILAGYGK